MQTVSFLYSFLVTVLLLSVPVVNLESCLGTSALVELGQLPFWVLLRRRGTVMGLPSHLPGGTGVLELSPSAWEPCAPSG